MTTKGTEMVKHESSSPAVLHDDLREREANVDEHYGAFVHATMSGALFAHKVGTDLNMIKAQSLHRAGGHEGTWDSYVEGRFNFSAAWAQTAMQFARDVPLATVQGAQLSLTQWSALIIRANYSLPKGKRGPVIEAAAAAVSAARAQEPASPSGGGRIKAGPKPASNGAAKSPASVKAAKDAVDAEIKKAGGEPRSRYKEDKKPVPKPAKGTGRGAPDEQTHLRVLTLGPGELPEIGELLLEDCKTSLPPMSKPKSPVGLQFRLVVGRQILVVKIGESSIKYMIAPNPIAREAK